MNKLIKISGYNAVRANILFVKESNKDDSGYMKKGR